MEDTDINQTLDRVRKFLMRELDRLPYHRREEAAQDITLDLWKYDLPNHDPDKAPLEAFLVIAAKRHAAKYLTRDLARYIRTRDVEATVAREQASRQLEAPRHPDAEAVEREALDHDAKAIKLNRGYHAVLLHLVMTRPDEPLYKLGRLAGYAHKGDTYRAMRHIRAKLAEAREAN